ncbi:MAG TPA: RNA methyltransferase [Chlamydiales bacterium]|nr:RNA methyltransferase [Chlamydiales bacterium]
MITSMQNPWVKKISKLRKRREREISNTFLIEGFRELTRAVSAGVAFEALFFCKELFLGENEESLIEKIQQNAKAIPVEKSIFEKISYRDRPDGLIAIAKTFSTDLERIEKIIQNKKSPFILIAESIEKPGNLGTILRSADAAGVDAVIVADPCTDLFNPNVVRASTGMLFSMPVATADNPQLLSFLEKYKIKTIAATPHSKKNYVDEDMTGPVAILVGTEQYGLSDFWMEKSLSSVAIPMKGFADSLNVATATTIMLYEVLRQRTQ